MSASDTKLRQIYNFVESLSESQMNALYNILYTGYIIDRGTKKDTIAMEFSELIDD